MGGTYSSSSPPTVSLDTDGTVDEKLVLPEAPIAGDDPNNGATFVAAVDGEVKMDEIGPDPNEGFGENENGAVDDGANDETVVDGANVDDPVNDGELVDDDSGSDEGDEPNANGVAGENIDAGLLLPLLLPVAVG